MTRAHAGQTRKGGQPYATHPAAVRAILTDELGVTDDDAEVAALLHDVVEDTPVTLAEIRTSFGARVAEMVDVLTKPPVPTEAIGRAALATLPVDPQVAVEQGLPRTALAHEPAAADLPGQIEPIARHGAGPTSGVGHPSARTTWPPDEPKAAMLRRYYARLRAADPLVRQIKLADRIHNLREMGAATAAFRAKYLRETELLLDDVLAGTPGIDVLRVEYERSLKRYADEAIEGRPTR